VVGFWGAAKDLGGQLRDPGRIQLDPDPQVGLVQGGLGDLGRHRDVHRVYEHSSGIVVVSLGPEEGIAKASPQGWGLDLHDLEHSSGVQEVVGPGIGHRRGFGAFPP